MVEAASMPCCAYRSDIPLNFEGLQQDGQGDYSSKRRSCYGIYKSSQFARNQIAWNMAVHAAIRSTKSLPVGSQQSSGMILSSKHSTTVVCVTVERPVFPGSQMYCFYYLVCFRRRRTAALGAS